MCRWVSAIRWSVAALPEPGAENIRGAFVFQELQQDALGRISSIIQPGRRLRCFAESFHPRRRSLTVHAPPLTPRFSPSHRQMFASGARLVLARKPLLREPIVPLSRTQLDLQERKNCVGVWTQDAFQLLGVCRPQEL